MSSGLASGQKIIGPVTMTGNTLVGQITDATLQAGDNTFTVPHEAAAVLIVCPLVLSAPELKLRTNLNSTDGGLPVAGNGWVAFPFYTGTSSLIIRAAGTIEGVELSFI